MSESIQERKKKATDAKYVINPKFPKEIFVDLTSYCNHQCVFCSNRNLVNKNTMKPDMVRRVLRQAYDNGTRDLGVYATGESFIVKELAEYIGLAKGIPLRPVFYSHLRDAVCYNQRIGDNVFDLHMTDLLTEQDWGNFSVFGSGGTIPYSRHSSSVLKSLPLKFADGRYIVYIKMEKA